MSELHPWLSPWVMEDLRPSEWEAIRADAQARARAMKEAEHG